MCQPGRMQFLGGKALLHWAEITTKYYDGLKFRRNFFSFFGLNLLFFFRGPTVRRSSDQHSTLVILATNIPTLVVITTNYGTCENQTVIDLLFGQFDRIRRKTDEINPIYISVTTNVL
jgi:hypothetical protein